MKQFRVKLEKETALRVGLCAVVCAVYLFFALQHIGEPFRRISEDTNGSNGVAARNLLRVGYLPLKFGLATSWLGDTVSVQERFYTHHPAGFIVPTLILYEIFGVNEVTTRLGPLLLMVAGVVFFYAALLRIFRTTRDAFLGVLIFVLLPGSIYYGKHFDMQAPSLAMALIAFSFFVLHATTQRRFFLGLFFAATFLGALVGWFFYFLPIAVWIVCAVPATARTIPHRILYLTLIPFMLFAAFAITMWHFYILNGTAAFSDLQTAFFNRTAGYSLPAWFVRLWWFARLNFTSVFSVAALAGLGIFISIFRSLPRRALLIPILLMPLLNLLVLRQWTMHPFGVMFFLPAIAVCAMMAFRWLLLRYSFVAMVLVSVVTVFGFIGSLSSLGLFYNKLVLLSEEDIALVQNLRGIVADGELCEGKNIMGIGFTGIINWYLEKRTSMAPDCFTGQSTTALLYHPRNGEFYQKELALFEEHGFVLEECATLWCVAVKQP